jgi:hypothetical protein
MMREYPAYARTISSFIVRGQKPVCVAVLFSERWGYFDHVPKVCIRPDEWARGRYEFRYLRDMHVVVVPGDGSADRKLAELLVDLMRAGPSLLWAYNPDGTKLYDGEFAAEIGAWVLQLSDREHLSYHEVKAAESVMEQAQRQQAALWTKEAERRQAGDIDAWVRWADLTQFGLKDQVRKLFSAPWQDDGEARAA